MKSGQTKVTFIALGFEIAASVVGGILLGLWLDGKTERSPLFLIVGAILGMAVATIRIVQGLRFIGEDGDGGGGQAVDREDP